MIQNSVNQMLGALAIGSRLGGDVIRENREQKFNQALNKAQTTSSIVASNKELENEITDRLRTVDKRTKEGRGLKQTLSNVKDYSQKVVGNTLPINEEAYKSGMESIENIDKQLETAKDDGLSKKEIKELEKQKEQIRRDIAEYSPEEKAKYYWDEVEKLGSKLDKTKLFKGGSSYYDKTQISQLPYVNKMNKLTIDDRMSELAMSRASKLAKGLQKQANDNHITNLNKTPVTPGQIRKEAWGEEQDYGI